MNSLQRLQAQAGHKVAERYYGAAMQVFQTGDPGTVNALAPDERVPCCHTHLRLDFVNLGAGIQAVGVIEYITFRAERCAGNTPGKGTPFLLFPANGAAPLALQLWSGGLLPDGLTYQFMAVDVNYKA